MITSWTFEACRVLINLDVTASIKFVHDHQCKQKLLQKNKGHVLSTEQLSAPLGSNVSYPWANVNCAESDRSLVITKELPLNRFVSSTSSFVPFTWTFEFCDILDKSSSMFHTAHPECCVNMLLHKETLVLSELALRAHVLDENEVPNAKLMRTCSICSQHILRKTPWIDSVSTSTKELS
ncbi:uncharacterized protein LOC113216745 [Frankliniella occidentalis]|uniref:Uncharacterized protein LOC113216745 n=1 Tax=Frankliniella occidentalis TaxID=133901 RepID=A0A9C6X649_FRAOC|nr:uncharacterized protein LOC113216745 [Frankliniella occidentalis]XP_052129833.1 uncharacterized protein LOC113216745 [Frankliniella occidentalis]